MTGAHIVDDQALADVNLARPRGFDFLAHDLADARFLLGGERRRGAEPVERAHAASACNSDAGRFLAHHGTHPWRAMYALSGSP